MTCQACGKLLPCFADNYEGEGEAHKHSSVCFSCAIPRKRVLVPWQENLGWLNRRK